MGEIEQPWVCFVCVYVFVCVCVCLHVCGACVFTCMFGAVDVLINRCGCVYAQLCHIKDLV